MDLVDILLKQNDGEEFQTVYQIPLLYHKFVLVYLIGLKESGYDFINLRYQYI